MVDCVFCKSIKHFEEAGFEKGEAIEKALKYTKDKKEGECDEPEQGDR